MYGVAVCLAVVMWHALPAEVRSQLPRPRLRHGIHPIQFMFVAWLVGWFGLLFVKIEDLNVLAPINYQAGMRWGSGLLIATAVVIAVTFFLTSQA